MTLLESLARARAENLSVPAAGDVDRIIERDDLAALKSLLREEFERPYFENELYEIMLRAGPRVAVSLASYFEEERALFVSILNHGVTDDIALKDLAVLIASGTSLLERYTVRNLEECNNPAALDLLALQQSNHSRMKIHGMHNIFAEVLATPPGGTFFGFSSPRTHLLKDTRKVT